MAGSWKKVGIHSVVLLFFAILFFSCRQISNPSFVQAWACLKLVSRAKQSLPVISLEIPVRPSWTKIKPSEIWRKCNHRRREPANLYQCRKDDWTTSKATPGKIGHEWKPKSSQLRIVKKQEEANIERVRSQNRPHWEQLHCWSWRRTNNASGTLKLKKRSMRRVYW